jgi:hypothetical protein
MRVMASIWTRVWRFLRGVTPAGTVLAGVVGTVLIWLALPLSTWALTWALPDGPNGNAVYVTSPQEAVIVVARARVTMSLVPALGWLLAAARGARAGAPSGVGQVALRTLPVLAAAAAAGLYRLDTLRSLMRESVVPGGVQPLITISSLDHWSWAMWGALLGATALFLIDRRRQRSS